MQSFASWEPAPSRRRNSISMEACSRPGMPPGWCNGVGLTKPGCRTRWPRVGLAFDALAWSSDNGLVAVGTKSGSVQVWNRDGQLRREFLTAEAGIGALHFNRDGRWLLAGGRSGGMQMWDVITGEQLLTGPDIPWSFARDGKHFASGSVEKVSFGELAAPAVVQQFAGHQSIVEKAVWSGDSRFLLTLDSHFELRVWDVERGTSVARFTVSPSSYGAANAGIAMSADRRHVAYASSGEKSAIDVFDLHTGLPVAHRDLPDGYARLTHDGAKFVLVREERKGEATRTMACTFTSADFELNWKELRSQQPGEVGFHNSALTPDGRYYLWAGPRHPANQMRVEVYEVATGRLVKQILRPHEKELQSWDCGISPDGRRVWVKSDSPADLLYDLSNDEPPTEVIDPPQSSPDLRWYASTGFAEPILGRVPIQSLRMGPSAATWLQFTNRDFSGPGSADFSPDGRFVSWYGSGAARLPWWIFPLCFPRCESSNARLMTINLGRTYWLFPHSSHFLRNPLFLSRHRRDFVSSK